MDVIGVGVQVDRYQGGTFWMGLKFDEPVGDEVVGLLCGCITMGAAAASESIHGHYVASVPRCEDAGIERRSAFLDPLVKGRCFGLKWYNLQGTVVYDAYSALCFGCSVVQGAEVHGGKCGARW